MHCHVPYSCYDTMQISIEIVALHLCTVQARQLWLWQHAFKTHLAVTERVQLLYAVVAMFQMLPFSMRKGLYPDQWHLGCQAWHSPAEV